MYSAHPSLCSNACWHVCAFSRHHAKKRARDALADYLGKPVVENADHVDPVAAPGVNQAHMLDVVIGARRPRTVCTLTWRDGSPGQVFICVAEAIDSCFAHCMCIGMYVLHDLSVLSACM